MRLYGIVKFINSGGSWQPAPDYFSATNIGTLAQTAANQGCFGICVDFSGAYPIIYATTMENGTAPPNNSQGNANQNRLIRIVDDGTNAGTNLVAETLATATSTNESFRGIDFTPDVTPLITSQPAPYSTTNGGNAYFSVTAQSVYPLDYQWLQNGTNLTGETSGSLSLLGVDISLNADTYQCIVSNSYGAATSCAGQSDGHSDGPVPGNHQFSGQCNELYWRPGELRSRLADGHRPFTLQWYFGAFPLWTWRRYCGSQTSVADHLQFGQSADAGSYLPAGLQFGWLAATLWISFTVQLLSALRYRRGTGIGHRFPRPILSP